MQHFCRPKYVYAAENRLIQGKFFKEYFLQIPKLYKDELVEKAKSCGLSADYVLFDTWFSAPAQLLAIKNAGLDAIAMSKKSSRIFYTYEGERLSLKKIYGICKKNRGRSKILLSVNVMVGSDDNQIPAKIVCVRNKHNKKDWIAFICTNPNLSDEEVVRIYGKRWQI